MDQTKNLYFNNILIKITLNKLKKYKYNNTLKRIQFENNLNFHDKIILKKRYNKPSDTLMISNLKYKNNLFKWYKIIKEFGNPILMNFLKIKNIKTNVLIVKFNSILETIHIIIALSNIKFGKKRLRLYFTNFKFIYNNV